jgi:hypothetical protein
VLTVLGQISEKFREAVKALGQQEHIPVYQFRHKEKKDNVANEFRRQRPVRDAIVFIGVAQEKAQAFNGRKVNGQFQFDRDKTVYSTTITSISMTRSSVRCFSSSAATRRGASSCALTGTNGPGGNSTGAASHMKLWTTAFCRARSRRNCRRSVMPWDRKTLTGYSTNGWTAFRCRSAPKTGGLVTTGICRSGRWKSV